MPGTQIVVLPLRRRTMPGQARPGASAGRRACGSHARRGGAARHGSAASGRCRWLSAWITPIRSQFDQLCSHGACAPTAGRVLPGVVAGPADTEHARTAGRPDAVTSSRRSTGSTSLAIGLPREESRGRLEDLALLCQQAVLATQPPQLLALVGGQALDAASVDVALAAPVTQCLLRHAQFSSNLLERRPGPNERHRLATELRWIRRTGSWHADILPAQASRPKHSSVHETGSTPVGGA